MYVVYGRMELFLPYCRSLKDKRKIINSIADRIRKRFNISILEVDYHDLWQRTALGFAAAASREREADFLASIVRETAENADASLEITGFMVEVIPYGR